MTVALAPEPGDVLVVGDLMVDVTARHRGSLQRGTDTPGQIRFGGGGSAANTACWLASLGVRPRLLAARGDDAMGAMAEHELVACGVDHLGPVLGDARTGACIVLVSEDGERTMVPDRGANDRLGVEAVAAALDPAPQWLHLSGYTLLDAGSRAAGLAAVAAGPARGLVVSVDASSAAPLRAVGAERFLGWIDGVALLFANDDEVQALGGIDALTRRVGAVVAKHGASGATWTDGVDAIRAASRPVAAVDSTGAGDAFAAGWIAAARRGATPAAALDAAVACGADAVTREGARPPEVDR